MVGKPLELNENDVEFETLYHLLNFFFCSSIEITGEINPGSGY